MSYIREKTYSLIFLTEAAALSAVASYKGSGTIEYRKENGHWQVMIREPIEDKAKRKKTRK